MRTWEDNKTAINQLWPMVQFTEEEKRLWREDLGSLDQDVLYDAIRNVKRGRDTLYPQLKWMLDGYRELFSLRRRALRQTGDKHEKLDLNISAEEDKRLATDFIAVIDGASPDQYESIENMVLDKLPRMNAATALRVLMYAKKRLLGQEALFGRVNADGDIAPLFLGAIK